MPYYHVAIGIKNRSEHLSEMDLSEAQLREYVIRPYHAGEEFLCDGIAVNPFDITYISISRTSTSFKEHKRTLLEDGDFDEDDELDDSDEEIVTREFIEHPPGKEAQRTKNPETLSKSIFIVHGRDHKPMKELKTMLFEFGLNPIVLHEQPSAGRTIVEKLEKYSDVGYAFVLLTPDDLGCSETRPSELKSTILEYLCNVPDFFRDYQESKWQEVASDLEAIYRNGMSARARQNVVLEFGYFIGLLGRNRVCCLYNGVELPSDMHGIVYIPFKDSVEEIRLKVMKELKETGYEIKI